MPPLTATSNPLEPVTQSPSCVKESGHCVRDAWIEKVVAAQEHQAATSSSYPSKQHLRSSESKSDSNDDVGGEHDYGEELQKYMAEATANLEKPLEDSDDSDEDSSDEDTDSESPRSDDIVDFDDMDDYVVPPVEIPRCYRTQDLRGGVVVGGGYVLFTNWAFKRQQRRIRHLRPIPERRDAGDHELPSSDGANGVKGRYSGKIVEL